VSAATRRVAARVPVQYLAVDLLWLDGESTAGLPYTARRERLDALGLAGPHWQTPPHFTGGGRYAREAARAQGLPGVIAKRLDSLYVPGTQTKDWRAVPV
jgi:bifunctional non-homologous end joining protein LigD